MPKLMVDGVPVADLAPDTARLLLGLGYETPGSVSELPVVDKRNLRVLHNRPAGEAFLRTYEYTVSVTLVLDYVQTEDRVERE